MKSNFMLLVGLSAMFVFLSIYGTSYVKAQSTNSSSTENETSANTALQTDNFDPFKSRTSSANNNNDDGAVANDASNNNNNDDSANTNNNNDDGDDDGSDHDNSNQDKKSKDDRKFELPFP